MKGILNLGNVASITASVIAPVTAPVVASVIASVIAPVIAPVIASVIAPLTASDTTPSPVTDSCDTFSKAKQDAVPTVAYAVAYNTSSYYLASAFDQAFAQQGTIFNFIGRAVTHVMHADSSSGGVSV